MLGNIREFLEKAFAAGDREQPPEERERALRIAIATLLVEMERADYVSDPAEAELLPRLLESHFSLERAEAEALAGEARARADEVVSLQEYTRLIHEKLRESDKHRFMEMLVRMAMADGRMDKHEQHLLSKIADLIYLRRADYVMIRETVVEEIRDRTPDGEQKTPGP